MLTDEFDREKAIACLGCLHPSRTEGREEWIRVGMALASVSEDLYEAWEEWSKSSAKFDERECRRQWESFKERPGGIGLGSLVRWAKDDSPSRYEAEVAPLVRASVKPERGEPKPSATDAGSLPKSVDGASLVAVYRYSDSFLVARYEGPKGKTYRPWMRDERGWRQGSPKSGIPPYRIDDALLHDGPVFVVEGEKAVEEMKSVGLVAVTSAGGSGSPHKTDWKGLAGRTVIVLPDNDAPGERYAEKVLGLLKEAGADRVSIVRPFGDRPGFDVADLIAERMEATGGDVEAAKSAVLKKAEDVGQRWASNDPSRELIGLLAEARKRHEGMRGRETIGIPIPKFSILNERLSGLRGLMVVAGAPGRGKTTLALQLGIEATKTEGVGFVYLSLEESKEEAIDRLLASLGMFDYRDMILRRGWNQEKEAKFAKAEASVAALSRKFRIIDAKDIGTLRADDGGSWHDPVSEIVSKTLADLGLREAVIVVDNLQALPVLGSWTHEMDRDRAVIEGLNSIHHETGCPVLVIAEITKTAFDTEPGLAAVSGTGRITYRTDATITMSEPRDKELACLWDKDDSGKKKGDPVLLSIPKGRKGIQRGRVLLRWDEGHVWLKEADDADQKEVQE